MTSPDHLQVSRHPLKCTTLEKNFWNLPELFLNIPLIRSLTWFIPYGAIVEPGFSKLSNRFYRIVLITKFNTTTRTIVVVGALVIIAPWQCCVIESTNSTIMLIMFLIFVFVIITIVLLNKNDSYDDFYDSYPYNY